MDALAIVNGMLLFFKFIKEFCRTSNQMECFFIFKVKFTIILVFLLKNISACSSVHRPSNKYSIILLLGTPLKCSCSSSSLIPQMFISSEIFPRLIHAFGLSKNNVPLKSNITPFYKNS